MVGKDLFAAKGRKEEGNWWERLSKTKSGAPQKNHPVQHVLVVIPPLPRAVTHVLKICLRN